MSRNIEIKMSLSANSPMPAALAALATEGPIQLAQDDTFFRCESGRLMLRAFRDGSGELIFYRRVDQSGPKESFYIRTPTPAPDSLRESLILAFGQIGRVRKHRVLYLIGRTRVHLDEVEDLGSFLELEVVLDEEESAEAGHLQAQHLMRTLGIDPKQLIHGSYLDLLRAGDKAVAA